MRHSPAVSKPAIRISMGWAMTTRAVIGKHVLDGLIRAKLGDAEECRGARPLPVAWKPRANGGPNWAIPGWTGDSDAVTRCTERIAEYLRILRSQFDIPEEA
jgi:hypothetical protein